ncbi:hypothetical protein [Myxococcus llanfairpwllgwyngyllgogerychwyrndrobwllllantysiliogogogochensis]
MPVASALVHLAALGQQPVLATEVPVSGCDEADGGVAVLGVAVSVKVDVA